MNLCGWSLSFCHTSEPLQRYRPQISSLVARDDRQEINQQLEGNVRHSPAFFKATKPAFLKATKSSRAYTFKLLLVGCPVLYILSLTPSSWVQYTSAIYSCLCRYTRKVTLGNFGRGVTPDVSDVYPCNSLKIQPNLD